MELLAPPTPQAAQALADSLGERARFIAGGTALQQEWQEPRLAPDGICFIDLRALPEVGRIELSPDHLHIGATASLETVRTHALVLRHARLLAQALGQLGAPGVRHQGTLGGNVGWRKGDCGPVLLALDAQAELADGRCEPLEQVLQRPVLPLLLGFRLPRADRHASVEAVFEKIGHRAAFSPARLALALRWQGPARGTATARIAAAAPGIAAHRLTQVETLLQAHAAMAPPSLAAVRSGCALSLPEEPALLASRLIAGHCGLL